MIARFASTCARCTRYSPDAYVSPIAPESASGTFAAASESGELLPGPMSPWSYLQNEFGGVAPSQASPAAVTFVTVVE